MACELALRYLYSSFDDLTGVSVLFFAMIRVQEIVKRFGDAEILQGVSFEALPNAVTGILGPNGAGKTTTLRILATLLQATSGRVEICGHDVIHEPMAVRKSIGFLTEEPGLYDRLTVREQLAFTFTAHRRDREAFDGRLDTLVEMLDLASYVDARAGTFSKGTRQKVSLARALIHDPPVLLLDEPTASLDLKSTYGVHQLLQGGPLKDKTVLLSTHIVEEAEVLCDTVVCMADGRVVASGTPAELVKQESAPDFRTALLQIVRVSEPRR